MLSKVRLGLHLLFHLTHSLGTLQCRSAHSLRAHQGLPGEVTMVMGQLVTAIGSCFQSSPGVFPRRRHAPSSLGQEEISQRDMGQKRQWIPLLLFAVLSLQGNICSLLKKINFSQSSFA